MYAVVVDVSSTAFVAVQFGRTEGKALAMDCLRMMGEDKSDLARTIGARSEWNHGGRADALVLDAASANVSNEFKVALRDLGTWHENPPAGRPWLRSHVEKCFQDHANRFVASFLGRTGSSVADTGDQDPVELTTLNADEFIRALLRHVLDIYHNTARPDLDGRSPRQVWDDGTRLYCVPPGPDKDHARAISGLSRMKPIDGRGIEFYGIRYNCLLLQQHRLRTDARVQVRIDESDLGRVSVLLADAWHTVPSVRRKFDGVPLAVHQDAIRRLKERCRANTAVRQRDIDDATRDIMRTAAHAAKRQCISQPRLGEDDMARHEETLMGGFRVEGDDEVLPVETFPTGGGEVPPFETRPTGGDVRVSCAGRRTGRPQPAD